MVKAIARKQRRWGFLRERVCGGVPVITLTALNNCARAAHLIWTCRSIKSIELRKFQDRLSSIYPHLSSFVFMRQPAPTSASETFCAMTRLDSILGPFLHTLTMFLFYSFLHAAFPAGWPPCAFGLQVCCRFLLLTPF